MKGTKACCEAKERGGKLLTYLVLASTIIMFVTVLATLPSVIYPLEGVSAGHASPTPTPAATSTPTPTPTAAATPTPTPTPTAAATPTPTPTPTVIYIDEDPTPTPVPPTVIYIDEDPTPTPAPVTVSTTTSELPSTTVVKDALRVVVTAPAVVLTKQTIKVIEASKSLSAIVNTVASVGTVLVSLLPATSVATMAVIALSSGVTVASVAANAPGGLIIFAQALIPFLTIRSRSPRWGRVVAKGTNLPVEGVVIIVTDLNGKPRKTLTSRVDGTFGVLLPIGDYRLKIQHPEYEFSSSTSGVALFPDDRLYDGEKFTVETEAYVLPLVVVVSPKPGVTITSTGTKLRLGQRLAVLHANWAVPALVVGAGINAVTLWGSPKPFFIFFGVAYIVFLLTELLLSRILKRAVGQIRDADTKKPIPLAIVRAVDVVTDRIVATEVTLPSGHFFMALSPGQYRLEIARAGYKTYVDARFQARKWAAGSIRLMIQLEPEEALPPSNSELT